MSPLLLLIFLAVPNQSRFVNCAHKTTTREICKQLRVNPAGHTSLFFFFFSQLSWRRCTQNRKTKISFTWPRAFKGYAYRKNALQAVISLHPESPEFQRTSSSESAPQYLRNADELRFLLQSAAGLHIIGITDGFLAIAINEYISFFVKKRCAHTFTATFPLELVISLKVLVAPWERKIVTLHVGSSLIKLNRPRNRESGVGGLSRHLVSTCQA